MTYGDICRGYREQVHYREAEDDTDPLRDHFEDRSVFTSVVYMTDLVEG